LKALLFDRSVPKIAAARVASGWRPGSGARLGPIRLADVEEPPLPGPGWQRVRPRLSGICGSDLATIDGRASLYFEPLVSFPFVPGHEVVGELDDGTRVVLEAVLGCAARGIDPPCEGCAGESGGACRNVAFGHLSPGLQTGYCADTGGGWGVAMVAHDSQIRRLAEDMDDETAVMIEPAACAIHAVGALHGRGPVAGAVAVVGAGTLGLCCVAALRMFRPPDLLIAVAKHPAQRRIALDIGADVAVEPSELQRAVRRSTGSMVYGRHLSGGVAAVIDCVGSSRSIEDSVAVVQPRGQVVLVGMPGRVSVDLTGLWHRQVALEGAYAYGANALGTGRRTFDLADELVRVRSLGRLVSALYTLDRYREAIEHAAGAGRLGSVKVAFDLRHERGRK
jgi:threonine dehydrogenase-like Zn-dependent dehydrogenase